jgi:hypothetical protein
MSKQRARELTSLGDKLFGKKRQLDSLCQEIAWQFAPDLANFTTQLHLGEDYVSDKMDGYPEQVSRELSNHLGAMLRPQDKAWFRATTLDEYVDKDEENAISLEYVNSKLRRYLYDPRSKFIRATKEADRFYVNFGQAVISVEEMPSTRDGLFFRCHHIKNCAWLENNIGDVDHMHRKDKMSARAMMRNFPLNKLHKTVKEAYEKNPDQEFDLRVITIPSDEYDVVRYYANEDAYASKKKKLPYINVYVDVTNETILREDGIPTFIYVVPRWVRFAETQYAFSPATMAGLADARMAQMLSQILLEAGEKAVDPPMIGKQEVVIGEPNIQAGAISWVDMEHDSKLTDALDVININSDLRVGFEMRRDVREMLAKAFYIDKLSLPQSGTEMTAFEVSRRLEEHVRNLLPLFEPMQVEYNTKVLDLSFVLLNNMRLLDRGMISPDLSDASFTWSFESPIQRARDSLLVERFKGTLEIVAIAKQLGAQSLPIHLEDAVRDAVRGVGGPAYWRKTPDEQAEEAKRSADEQELAKGMMQAKEAAGIASQAGDAANKLGFQASADKMLAAQAKSNGGSPQQDQGQQQPKMQESGPEMWSLLDEDVEPNQVEEGGMPQYGNGSAAPGMPATPLQRAGGGQPLQDIQGLANMQMHILSVLSSIHEAVTKPKTIQINRDKSGKIVSASATVEGE